MLVSHDQAANDQKFGCFQPHLLGSGSARAVRRQLLSIQLVNHQLNEAHTSLEFKAMICRLLRSSKTRTPANLIAPTTEAVLNPARAAVDLSNKLAQWLLGTLIVLAVDARTN